MPREAKYDTAAETLLDKWEAAMRASMEEAERLKRPVPDLYWSMHALHPDLLALVTSRHVLQARCPVTITTGDIAAANALAVSVGYENAPKPAQVAPVGTAAPVPQDFTPPEGIPNAFPSPPPAKPKTARALHFLQKLRLAADAMGPQEAATLRGVMKTARDKKWNKTNWVEWVREWHNQPLFISDEANSPIAFMVAVARAIKPILLKDTTPEAPTESAAAQ